MIPFNLQYIFKARVSKCFCKELFLVLNFHYSEECSTTLKMAFLTFCKLNAVLYLHFQFKFKINLISKVLKVTKKELKNALLMDRRNNLFLIEDTN